MPLFAHRVRAVAALLAFAVPQISAAAVRPGKRALGGPPPVGPVAFAAPAGDRPAGSAGAVRILPSGRILRPFGPTVEVGAGSTGLALSPDGRYAVVANAAEGDASLAVVDLTDLRVVSRTAPGWSFTGGLAIVADPVRPGTTLVLACMANRDAVAVFDLAPLGTLVPDVRPILPLVSGRGAGVERAFPTALRVAPGGLHVAVLSALSDTVESIDLRTRLPARAPVAVGRRPEGAAYAGARLLVSAPGSVSFAKLPASVGEPSFTVPEPDSHASSSLNVLPAAPGDASPVRRLALDSPAGMRLPGGAHPGAIVAAPSGAYAFVAMTNVDRIAVVALSGGAPRVVGGTDLRLYPRGPYGTHPGALALTADGKRLYVALAGIDAVAVLDASNPLRLRRLGLVPTGLDPTALALSPEGRSLYVLNSGGPKTLPGTLQRITLADVHIRPATLETLADLRSTHVVLRDPLVPQVLGRRPSSAIRHVVLLQTDPATYDALFGDLRDERGRVHGPGDPRFALFGRATPNLHALARTFALAGNLYGAPTETLAYGELAAGENTPYARYVDRTRTGRAIAGGHGADPEDAGRGGTIFTSLAAHGRSFRDYGAGLRLAGDDNGLGDPKDDDPASFGPSDMLSPTRGLGVRYSLAVPAEAALGGHVDATYPAPGSQISARRRAREFLRDAGRSLAANNLPAFVWIALPAVPPSTTVGRPAAIADVDAAVGAIVESLTHAPSWTSTAIILTPGAVGAAPDHLDPRRSYAIVISPWAKRGYVSPRHISNASVLKTEEALLGLPAISLGDDLASDLSDAFAPKPNFGTFTAVVDPSPAHTP